MLNACVRSQAFAQSCSSATPLRSRAIVKARPTQRRTAVNVRASLQPSSSDPGGSRDVRVDAKVRGGARQRSPIDRLGSWHT